MGLACERPGMGVFQRSPDAAFSASHLTGAGRPSTTPEAFEPRNCGQFCARAPEAARHRQKMESVSRFIIEPRYYCGLFAGSAGIPARAPGEEGHVLLTTVYPLQQPRVRPLFEVDAGDLACLDFEGEGDAVELGGAEGRLVEREQRERAAAARADESAVLQLDAYLRAGVALVLADVGLERRGVHRGRRLRAGLLEHLDDGRILRVGARRDEGGRERLGGNLAGIKRGR